MTQLANINDRRLAFPPISRRGTVKRVNEPGASRVSRLGWKNDHATLRAFCADAYLNEMGITNPDVPNGRTACALDTTQFGDILDLDDEPEGITLDDGRADTDRFADFIRALAPPPQLPMGSDAKAGQMLFTSLRCDGCHVETLSTSATSASFIPPSI